MNDNSALLNPRVAIIYFFAILAGVFCALIPALVVPAFIAAILIFAILLRQPLIGLYCLAIASLFSLISADVGPFTIRLDQVIVLFVGSVLLIQFIAGARIIVRTELTWWIIAYLLVNVISSIIHSPDLKMSLQRCLLLAITFSAYFVTTQLIRNETTLRRMIGFLIAAGVLEGIFGIASVPLLTIGIETGGAERPFRDIYARGTFLEGNLFGSFEMMIGLILISFLFSDYFKKQRSYIVIAFVLVLIASMMSFTRAAWLGLLIGTVIYLLLFQRKIATLLLRNIQYLILFMLVCGVASYFLLTTFKIGNLTLYQIYSERLNNILQYESGTGSSRLTVWKESIHLWLRNPFLGNGTDSIKVLGALTTMPKFGPTYWIPNSLLLALHDTGLIGLFIFAGIQAQLLHVLYRARNRSNDPYFRSVLEGLFIAFVGIQFAYLFTSAFWLIFIWVFMGIASSAARLAEQKNSW